MHGFRSRIGVHAYTLIKQPAHSKFDSLVPYAHTGAGKCPVILRKLLACEPYSSAQSQTCSTQCSWLRRSNSDVGFVVHPS